MLMAYHLRNLIRFPHTEGDELYWRVAHHHHLRHNLLRHTRIGIAIDLVIWNALSARLTSSSLNPPKSDCVSVSKSWSVTILNSSLA